MFNEGWLAAFKKNAIENKDQFVVKPPKQMLIGYMVEYLLQAKKGCDKMYDMFESTVFGYIDDFYERLEKIINDME